MLLLLVMTELVAAVLVMFPLLIIPSIGSFPFQINTLIPIGIIRSASVDLDVHSWRCRQIAVDVDIQIGRTRQTGRGGKAGRRWESGPGISQAEGEGDCCQ